MYIKCLIFAVFIAAVSTRPDSGENKDDATEKWQNHIKKCLADQEAQDEFFGWMRKQETCSNKNYSDAVYCILSQYDGLLNGEFINTEYKCQYKKMKPSCFDSCRKYANDIKDITVEERVCEFINCIKREKCIKSS